MLSYNVWKKLRYIRRILFTGRDYFLLLLVFIISSGMLFFANDTQELAGIHSIAIEVIGRLSRPLATVQNHLNVYQDNRALYYQNALLQIRNAQLQEAFYENRRLRKLLGFKLQVKYSTVPARVIGTDDIDGISTLIIDVGEDKYIEPNMAIVSGDGLVGRTLRVSGQYTIGQLLTDRNFRAAATIQRSRIQGVFQSLGQGKGFFLGAKLRADVQEGDVIVASGLNSIYPPGLRIGTVTHFEEAQAGLLKNIYVAPSVDFRTLEEVVVIKFAPPKFKD